MTVALALALAVFGPASPAAGDECPFDDNGCNARLFERRAAQRPAYRALYLYNASKSYLRHFDKLGDVADLCAARRTIDASLAVADQPHGQRALSETQFADQLAHEATAGARCGKVEQRRQQKDAPRVARRGKREPPADLLRGPSVSAPTQPVDHDTAPKPAPAEPASTTATSLSVAASVEPIATSTSPSDPASPANPPPSGVTPKSPDLMPVPAYRSPKPARRLMISGGAVLSVGVGLAALAGYAGGRLVDVSRASYDLYEETHGQGDADALAEEAALRRVHGQWLPVTVGAAVAGGATMIIGAVLLAVGKRRMPRLPSQAALIPVPGGLVIRARF